MKITLEMPFENYTCFLNKLVDTTLPEYSVLRNGMVIHRQIDGAERPVAIVMCEVAQAQKLLMLAQVLALPLAEQDIKRALDGAYKL
jgi:hypothetical protein